MKASFAKGVTDAMYARAIYFESETASLILCVVDSCLIPREICDAAKAIAAAETGIPASQMLISATHSHTCAAMAPVFQTEVDPGYLDDLPPRIAAAMVEAYRNREPAEFGTARDAEPKHVFNRRWRIAAGQSYENPFGAFADRVWTNPGVRNPQVVGPAGPVDPAVHVLAARSAVDGRPLALLANYSLHYVGGLPAISADYFGAFAQKISRRLTEDDRRYDGKPAFVGLLSNGTSGDISSVDHGAPIKPVDRFPGDRIAIIAEAVAEAALRGWNRIEWQAHVTVRSIEHELSLRVRKPTAAEIEDARRTIQTTLRDKDGQFSNRKAIYALETLHLAEFPDEVGIKLQAHRLGDLTISAAPCEIFVEIGLALKASMPLRDHFTISLANGYNGYLPTEEQHALGGYETWRARSSYLETAAAPLVLENLRRMITEVAR